MKNIPCHLSALAIALLPATVAPLQAQQPWISLSPVGKLMYNTTAQGDKIMLSSFFNQAFPLVA
jgi:hypothetical protein